MDLFRKVFGMDRNEDHNQFRKDPRVSDYDSNDFYSEDPFSRRSFDVLSDPIQMHRYFEQQLSDVLKIFGLYRNSEFSIGIPNSPLDDWSQTPPSGPSENPENLRDQFLKPGYEKPVKNYSDMVDRDLDESVKNGNVSKVLEGKFGNEVMPYEKQKPKSFFFGTSQSIRTIQNPDGSIETHRTTRDNEGNEETTVCHKIGNKEYCVIKKKNKYGKEEVSENFVNIDEKEKDIFTKPKNNQPSGHPYSTSDFWSKFF
ncbi:uncharacterized protein LOC130451566 [Diorhabda sublineata]|uniref:uncharacterized protein LOC130451566 n=1 Tax=Diorhabda sublineata TaxID=1163346 RepID=UPI0024E096BA|nr:uncharacterized protein LOC130451566 [Diorhabda sublineata]